jgi:hypothetical protein
MSRLMIAIVFLAMLCVTSSLFACEDCYLRGMRTPSGTVPQRATCWSSPDGVSEGCLPLADGSNCELWSYGSSCPESSDDENGSGGGGTGGGGTGGGGGCTTTATGSCPAECFSCGGGGGGFLF